MIREVLLLLLRAREFGLFLALRYTRISFDLTDEHTARISKFLSRRTRGAFGSHSVAPKRGFAADGSAGLPPAPAVRRDDAQQSCVSSGEIAGCAGTASFAFQFSRNRDERRQA